jgi:hypothetical protein
MRIPKVAIGKERMARVETIYVVITRYPFSIKKN